MRPRFSNSIALGGSIALLCVIGLSPARISAQSAILDKTTFGHSQNDGRDLANSLVPGEKKYGKHEKNEEVNPAELKSKTNEDTTFGGSLLNIGIVGAEPKLDESKRRAVESEKDLNSVKPSAATEKEPLLQLSDGTILQQQARESDIAAADRQAKASGGSTAANGDGETRNKQQPASAEPPKDKKSSPAATDRPTIPAGDH